MNALETFRTLGNYFDRGPQILSWILAIPLLANLVVFGNLSVAEPTSDLVKVKSLRPYIGDDAIFVEVDRNALCNTSVFTINISSKNGKEAYAALTTALLAGRSVKVELHNVTQCNSRWPNGWGAPLQSVYLY